MTKTVRMLKNVATSPLFAHVDYAGFSFANGATHIRGVCPQFLIG